MDLRSQEYLNKILAKEPETLNENEKDFLRARQSYLKKIHLEEYASILKVKNQTPKGTVKENAKKQKKS